MARGVNKVIIVGNLGQDPETRYTGAGSAITNISVATSESWKDKQTNQNQEKTEWHRIVFFNRLAEIAGEYLTKGSKVYIEGKLQTRKWQDQNGQDKYTTEIVAKEMQMLDSGEGNSQRNTGMSAPAQGNYGVVQSQQNAGAQNAAESHSNQAPEMDSFDDDIPF